MVGRRLGYARSFDDRCFASVLGAGAGEVMQRLIDSREGE